MSCPSLRLPAAALMFGLFSLPLGCGPAETPQTIEGKAPADYREDIEKQASRPLGPPPAKGKAAPGNSNSKAQSR